MRWKSRHTQRALNDERNARATYLVKVLVPLGVTDDVVDVVVHVIHQSAARREDSARN